MKKGVLYMLNYKNFITKLDLLCDKVCFIAGQYDDCAVRFCYKYKNENEWTETTEIMVYDYVYDKFNLLHDMSGLDGLCEFRILGVCPVFELDIDLLEP